MDSATLVILMTDHVRFVTPVGGEQPVRVNVTPTVQGADQAMKEYADSRTDTASSVVILDFMARRVVRLVLELTALAAYAIGNLERAKKAVWHISTEKTAITGVIRAKRAFAIK